MIRYLCSDISGFSVLGGEGKVGDRADPVLFADFNVLF